MYLSHKSNVVQQVHETEWLCRRLTKRLNKSEYWAWLDSVTTVTGDSPDEVKTIDYSGETGYTIVECTDEDVWERLAQLSDYVSIKPEGTTYNIKYYASKRDAEEIKDVDGKNVLDEDGEKTYVQSHFVGDDTAKDARILADQWAAIRAERDRLLTNSDWTQGADSPLASGKKTEWATYRTKLRTLPEDQKDKTTYASITWPSEPS